MKTIIIDNKKIEISDESCEAFKKQFVTKDKAILWKQQGGNNYWTNSEYYQYIVSEWESDAADYQRYELGNIYKTKEEAQEALDTGWIAKRKAEVKILRFIAENDLEWDWEAGESNYGLYYHSREREFDYLILFNNKHSILPYFKSREDAQKVIDAMTPELKILFGVK